MYFGNIYVIVHLWLAAICANMRQSRFVHLVLGVSTG
jgi:hypothetical protein